jgi:hypothetical protein
LQFPCERPDRVLRVPHVSVRVEVQLFAPMLQSSRGPVEGYAKSTRAGLPEHPCYEAFRGGVGGGGEAVAPGAGLVERLAALHRGAVELDLMVADVETPR